MAEARTQHHRQRRHREDQRAQHQPVEMHGIVDAQRPRAEHAELGPEIDVGAVAAAGDLGVVEDEIDHLRERQRDHDEVDAPRAQHQHADQQRQHRRRGNRRHQQPPAIAGLGLRRQHRGRIGRGGEVRGMAQADQARIADQQLQRQREDRHDHHLAEQVDVELVALAAERQRQRGQRREGDRPRQRGPAQAGAPLQVEGRADVGAEVGRRCRCHRASPP